MFFVICDINLSYRICHLHDMCFCEERGPRLRIAKTTTNIVNDTEPPSLKEDRKDVGGKIINFIQNYMYIISSYNLNYRDEYKPIELKSVTIPLGTSLITNLFAHKFFSIHY